MVLEVKGLGFVLGVRVYVFMGCRTVGELSMRDPWPENTAGRILPLMATKPCMIQSTLNPRNGRLMSRGSVAAVTPI